MNLATTFEKKTTTQFLWVLRLIVAVLLIAIAAGLVLEVLPFSLFLIYVALSLLAPLLWIEFFGSWAGLGTLFLLAIGAGLLMRLAPESTTGGAEAIPAALLLFLLIAACFAAPTAFVLLLWQRQASVAIILLSFATFPVVINFFIMSGTFIQSMNRDAAEMATNQMMLWLPLLCFPMTGCCFGPLAFIGSFTWLLWREMAAGRRVNTRPRAKD